MKKIIIPFILLLLICGCGEKSKKNNQNEVNLLDEIVLEVEDANLICYSSKVKDDFETASKIAVSYDDNDIITSIESYEIISSNNTDILNDYESYFNSNYEKIANYGGYTYDIHQEKKKLIANTIIDFNTFNIESYTADYPDTLESFNEEYKLEKDKLIEVYNNNGYTCEKK